MLQTQTRNILVLFRPDEPEDLDFMPVLESYGQDSTIEQEINSIKAHHSVLIEGGTKNPKCWELTEIIQSPTFLEEYQSEDSTNASEFNYFLIAKYRRTEVKEKCNVQFLPMGSWATPLYPPCSSNFDIRNEKKIKWVVDNIFWRIWDSVHAMEADSIDSSEEWKRVKEGTQKWKLDHYQVYQDKDDLSSGVVIVRFLNNQDDGKTPMAFAVQVPEDIT